ncbi:hypothetical protein [Saccharibacillus sacchari]|uniref:Uncharacterized protein n=1 Tax=Saccharibacillus sacchari TaxID=456493 RepID=A0ACC6PCX1_9BACL
MKAKWMLIGLIALLTACAAPNETDQQASLVAEQQTAAQEDARPETKTTVNEDGSVTTETVQADGTVTTTTTSKSVATATVSGNGQTEASVQIGENGTVDVDATMNVDTTMNVDATVNADIDTATTTIIENYEDYDPEAVVSAVTEGALTRYSSEPIGEVFDAFFSNPNWEYFKSETDDDVVEFTGDAMYGEEQVHTTIQFLLYEDLTFELTGIWLVREGETLDEEYSMPDGEIDDTLDIIYGLNQ